jgi:hypothetical protein
MYDSGMVSCLHADYKREMGDIKPDTLVTMHMIVRPAAVATKPGQGGTMLPHRQFPTAVARHSIESTPKVGNVSLADMQEHQHRKRSRQRGVDVSFHDHIMSSITVTMQSSNPCLFDGA